MTEYMDKNRFVELTDKLNGCALMLAGLEYLVSAVATRMDPAGTKEEEQVNGLALCLPRLIGGLSDEVSHIADDVWDYGQYMADRLGKVRTIPVFTCESLAQYVKAQRENEPYAAEVSGE